MDWADKCALYHCSFVVQMLRLWTVASSHVLFMLPPRGIQYYIKTCYNCSERHTFAKQGSTSIFFISSMCVEF